MTSSLFLNVSEHFVKHSNASIDNQALLIMDNHEAHLSIDVIKICQATWNDFINYSSSL